MTRFARTVSVVMVAAALGLGVSEPAFAAPPNLIVDGDFEPPIASRLYYRTLTIGAWTVTKGAMSIEPDSLGIAPQSGLQKIGSYSTGIDWGISQSFATTTGTTYEITYYTHSNFSGPSRETVLIDDAVIDTSTSAYGWTPHTVRFVATSALTTLTLQSSIINSAPGYFDNVQVLPVPVDTPMIAPVILTTVPLVALVGGIALMLTASRRSLRRSARN